MGLNLHGVLFSQSRLKRSGDKIEFLHRTNAKILVDAFSEAIVCSSNKKVCLRANRKLSEDAPRCRNVTFPVRGLTISGIVAESFTQSLLSFSCLHKQALWLSRLSYRSKASHPWQTVSEPPSWKLFMRLCFVVWVLRLRNVGWICID